MNKEDIEYLEDYLLWIKNHVCPDEVDFEHFANGIMNCLNILDDIKMHKRFGIKEYLYDKKSKREVELWYKCLDGQPLIDLDPYGLSMSGKRTVKYADKERYEIRYKINMKPEDFKTNHNM